MSGMYSGRDVVQLLQNQKAELQEALGAADSAAQRHRRVQSEVNEQVAQATSDLGVALLPALDAPSLARAARMVCDAPAGEVARRHALDVERVRLLPAGILILDAAVRRLGCALHVARGGLREGVCLALAGHTSP